MWTLTLSLCGTGAALSRLRYFHQSLSAQACWPGKLVLEHVNLTIDLRILACV